MKICIVIASLSGGGAEFVAREWAGWLARRGHSVTVAVTKVSDMRFESGGFEVHQLVGSNPIRHVQSMRVLVSQKKFDVVLGMLPYFNLLAILGSLWQLNRPRVAISGRNVEVPFPHVHGKNVIATRALSRILYPMADAYLAISHPVAAEAGALYRIKPHKIVVVPNPATGKSAVESTAPIELDQPEVLNLIVPARIAAQKRPLLVLDVAKILQHRGHTVAVHFFGDGDRRSMVEAAGQELKIPTHIHGWHEQWFAKAPKGVVILTSLAEGFGNVFVEAANVGLPSVVSSKCLGAADAVVPGLTGVLAAGDTPSSYADAVIEASELTMRQEAIDQWLTRFSVKNSGVALEQFLTEMRNRV